MRNFDERKAEIFRRSENRIKERKRTQNRILALCVPLCLCIAILSVIYLPDMMISSDKSNNAENMNMAGGVENESGLIYTSLEIKINVSSGTEKNYTNKENIENIYNIIQSAFTVENDEETATNIDEFSQSQKPESQKGESATKGEDNYSTNQSQSFGEGITYTLTFTADNGQKIVYILCDGILTNKSTNESVPVTDDLLKDLYTKVSTVTYGKEKSK